MQLPTFLLDRWLGAHEFAMPPIRYNLASSTGPSWTLEEILALTGEPITTLGDIQLGYSPAAGSAALRQCIAKWYDVDPDWIVTTTGASEALVAQYALASEPNASIALPFPLFPAMPTMAKAWGLRTTSYHLERKHGFVQTAERVLAAVQDDTALVLVNTPHNPTGSVLSGNEAMRLAASLAERGIPLLVDEVYHPLYFKKATPSAAQLPNTIVVSDFSKAFSLPGLRVGWVIERDMARRERMIDLRSYLTICGSPLTEAIAVLALRHIDRILERLNRTAQANRLVLEQFMNLHRDTFAWVPPGGGTVAFPWRLDGSNSRPMCEALARAGVLFAPGDCFEAPTHFRIGFGKQSEGFADALEIASRCIKKSN